MVISLTAARFHHTCTHTSASTLSLADKWRPSTDVATQEILFRRRHALLCASASLIAILAFNQGIYTAPLWAAEVNQKAQENNGDKGIFDLLNSLVDPNEKTKSGKALPKAYLQSAREVVKTLRESLKEDTKDVAKFRRTADAAKESIREFLSGWKGQQAVVAEESYVALEKAIRSLASFYGKAGPFAPLPEEVKSGILDQLNAAEASL